MKSVRFLIINAGLMSTFLLMAACTNGQSEAATNHVQTTGNNKGFAVVELFTSEGCSSCPPADKLIEKIQKENANKQIYLLAFHVDYWDHQGWKDKFSAREFTARQRMYASWLNLQTIYTPQIVVNGATEYVGSDESSVVKAISEGLDQVPVNTLTGNGRIENNKINIRYQDSVNEKGTELVLALVQKTAHSNVRAGENAGRSLSHVQIVRQLQRVDINSKKNIAINLPADFTKEGWELIGMVQRTSDGRITAAARFDL